MAGRPFAALLTRKKKNEDQRDMVPLSFLMGTAFIILLSFWLSSFGMPMKYAIYIVCAVSAGAWAIALKNHFMQKSFCTKNMVLFGACFAAGSFALIPMVFFKACFPYSDGYTYLCIADFLVDKGYSYKVVLDGHFPWLTQIYLYQVQNLRMGAQCLLAFWTSMLHQEYSLFTYTPVSALGVFLYGMSIWLFISKRQQCTEKNILYAVVFSAFNVPIIIWSAVFGFFPQLFGLVFMAAALKPVIALIKETDKTGISVVLEAAVFIAAMALCYSEIVPFFAFGVLCVFIYEVYGKKKWRKSFAVLLETAVLSSLFMGPYFIKMILGIMAQFGAVVGGEKAINWFGYLSYWLSSAPVEYNFKESVSPISIKVLFVGLTVTMMVMLMVGFSHSRKKDKWKYLQEGIAISVPYFVMLVYFSCIAENPFGKGVGNSWSIYKLAQYYFIILCCYLFLFYADVFTGKGKIMKNMQVLFPIIFCIASLVNTTQYSYHVTRLMYEYTGNTDHPIEDYMQLADKYKDETKVIHLVNLPNEPRKFLTYILKNNKLSSDWSTDGYFGIYGQGMDPVYDPEGITLKYDPKEETAIAGMVAINSNYVDIKNGAGVGTVETDGINDWSWNDEISAYTIVNHTQFSDIQLSFEASCADHGTDNILDVYLENELLTSQSVDNADKKKVFLNISVEPEESVEVKFHYRGEKSAGTLADSRELAICIWNIAASIDDRSIH